MAKNGEFVFSGAKISIVRAAFVLIAIVSIQALCVPVYAQPQEAMNCADLIALANTGKSIDSKTGAPCVAELLTLSADQQIELMRNYLRHRGRYIPKKERRTLIQQLTPEAARMLKSIDIGRSYEQPGEEKTRELDDLIAQAQAVGDGLSLAYLNYFRGIRVYQLEGDTAQMETYLLSGRAYAEDNGIVRLLPAIIGALAVRANSDGDSVLAMELYEQAIESYSALDGESARAGIYAMNSNIGQILLSLGDHEAAIKRHQRSLEGYRQLETRYDERISLVLQYIAQALSLLDRHNEAIGLLEEARAAARLGKAEYLEGAINFSQAKSFFAIGQRDQAIDLAEQSIAQNKEYREPAVAAVGLTWLAARYLEDNDLDKTLAALDQANALMGLENAGAQGLVNDPGDTSLALDYAKTLGRLLVQMNRADEAAPYLDAALTLSEDRFEKEKVSAVVNSELLFDLREKEVSLELMRKEAAVAELEVRDLRTRTVLGFLAAGFVGVIALFFYRSYRLQKRLSETKDTFLSEIHHRTKNNLQILSSLLRLDARRDRTPVESVSRQLDAATRARTMALVHDHIYNHREPDTTKVDIKPFIEDLIKLLDESLGRKNIILESDVISAEIDVDQVTPYGLIVCELVSNAYKHAFGAEGGKVKIGLTGKPGSLVLSVQDDGDGFDPSFAREKEGSLGLSLIQDLSDQIDGRIDVKTDTTGTSWTLSKV